MLALHRSEWKEDVKVLASDRVDLILTDVDMSVTDGRTRPRVKENNMQT
jgi:hypothetical protein